MNIPGTNGPDRLQGGLPSFQISNWSNLGNDGTGNPFQFRDNQYSTSVNLQKQVNQHLFRGGMEYLDQQINHFQPQGGTFQTVRGTFIFNGQATMLQDAPAPADVQVQLVGRVPARAADRREQCRQSRSARQPELDLHEDVVGLRPGHVAGQSQHLAGARAALGAPAVADATRRQGRESLRSDGRVRVHRRLRQHAAGHRSDRRSGIFMPRLGLTYRLGEKTVFRGGYARSADNSSFVNFRNSYPSVFAWSMAPGRFNGVENIYVPVTTLRQGIAPPIAPPDVSSGQILLPAGVGTTTYPKDLDRGHVDSFNVTVQHELTSWLTGQAAYVGTRAIGQHNFVNINAGAPGTGNAGRPLFLNGLTNATADINSYEPYGDTVYDGLQTQLRARSRSAQGGIVYTWSKTTNFADNGGGNAAGAGGPRIQYLPEKDRNKGRAGYDRPQNFQAYWAYNLPFGKDERWATSGWSWRCASAAGS